MSVCDFVTVNELSDFETEIQCDELTDDRIPVDYSLDWLDDLQSTQCHLNEVDWLDLDFSMAADGIDSLPPAIADSVFLKREKRIPAIAAHVASVIPTNADIALREEMFCRLIVGGRLVLPSTFDLLMGTPSPLETIERDEMTELYADDLAKIERVMGC